MKKTELLEYGEFYHLYNRGIDRCSIFREVTNYEYFLKLQERYISKIADTYAFVLMNNHFHFLVLIKDKTDLPGFSNLEGLQKPPYQYFSNLFNAYTKAFNKKYNRTGSLFEKNFRRKRIDTQEYLKQVLLYIHNNPVHHRFCERAEDYPWSSYKTCISLSSTNLMQKNVIGWFDDLGNFKYHHERKLEIERIEKWLKI